MELVELYGRRESMASVVNPADRTSTRLRAEELAEEIARLEERGGGSAPQLEALRREMERRGLSPQRGKRRASAATRIGKYTEPVPEASFRVEHPAHVVSVASFHPENDERGRSSGEPFVASGCENGDIHITSLLTGESRKVIRVHKDIVTCLRIYQPKSSSLLVIVSGSADLTVQITIVESGASGGTLVDKAKGHSKDVWCLEMIEQEGLEPIVVSGGLDGKICVWSMLQRELMQTFWVDAGPVYCLSVQVESDLVEGAPLIFAGHGDRSVRMWSLGSNEVQRVFKGHSKRITCLAVLSPRPVLGGIDYEKYMSEAELRLQEINRVKENCCTPSSCCSCCCCCPDKDKKAAEKESAERSEFEKIKQVLQDDLNILSRDLFVVSGSEDGYVRVFHAATGTMVRIIEAAQRSPVHSLSFTLKASQFRVQDAEPVLAVGCKSGMVQLWHLDTGRLLRSLPPPPSSEGPSPILALDLTTRSAGLRSSHRLGSSRKGPSISPPSVDTQPVAGAGTGTGAGSAASSSQAPIVGNLTILVTASGDRTLRIMHLRSFFDEAYECYMDDQRERLPNSQMRAVPEEFSKWPRVYLLSRKFGSLDEFFSGPVFALFDIAMYQERLDFISTFLPHALTGLLVDSRKAAIRRFYDDAKELFERRLDAQNAGREFKYSKSNVSAIAVVFVKMLARNFIFNRNLVTSQSTRSKAARDGSLLFKAVESRDVLVVRIVLDAWLRLVQIPPKDLLDQSAGPAMCLSKRDLMHVADIYPSEFEHIICSIKLLPVHPSISQSCTYTLGHGKVRKDKGSEGSFLTDLEIWRSLSHAHSQEPCTCLYLPLRQAADLDMVQTYVNTCKHLKSLRIFSSDVGITVNHYAWGAYGMRVHRSAFFWYLFDCVLFLVYVFTAAASKDDRFLGVISVQSIHSLCIAYQASYLMARFRTELQQIMFEPMRETHYKGLAGSIEAALRNVTPWRVFDTVWLVCRMTSSRDGDDSVLMAVSSLLQWVRLMYYFRAFESTGLLVAMILRIVSEIKFYLVVIFIVILFFSESFWVLSSPDLSRPFDKTNSGLDNFDDATRLANVPNSNPFGNQGSALLTSFTFIFGSYQPAFFTTIENNQLRHWAVLVSIIFMLIVCVLLFNLLIAFMSDIFSRMSQTGRSQWRLMQAKTVYESGYLITSTFNKTEQLPIISPKLVHVLRRTSDMTMDSLQQSLDESDADLVSARLVRHCDKSGSDLSTRASATEEQILARLQHQQSALEVMIRAVEDITSNPTGREAAPQVRASTRL